MINQLYFNKKKISMPLSQKDNMVVTSVVCQCWGGGNFPLHPLSSCGWTNNNIDTRQTNSKTGYQPGPTVRHRELYSIFCNNIYGKRIGKRMDIWGFPGGAVVEKPPANAGDTGLSPGLGRSHMPRSNWAREPQLLSLRVWSLCSTVREATITRGPRTAMKSGPRSPQLEKALTQKRRPNTTKNK